MRQIIHQHYQQLANLRLLLNRSKDRVFRARCRMEMSQVRLAISAIRLGEAIATKGKA